MQTDRFLGIAIMALATAVIFLAIPSIPLPVGGALGTGRDWIGPRLFPYIASSLCFLAGLQLALKSGGAGQERRAPEYDWRSLINVVGLVALSVAYIASMEWLGYTLSTALVVALFFLLFRERRILIVAAFAILVPSITTFVFGGLLGTRLPKGALVGLW